MTVSEEAYVWTPDPERVEGANVTRLMRRLDESDIDTLRARSTADIATFWHEVIQDLQLPFERDYERVLDSSRGPEWPEWFVGGACNVVEACLTRWAQDADMRDRDAVVHEAEDGTVRRLTFAELAAQVDRVAAGLQRLGLQRGEAIGVYVPMTPEAIVAVYAVARLGAVLVPLFSGFASGAVAARLQDADARAIIVADGTVRRGRQVDMLGVVRDGVVDAVPSLEHVVVIDNVAERDLLEGEVRWSDLIATEERPVTDETPATAPLLLAYTSGTTGRPKGAVHTHAGFLLKVASEVAYSFDVGVGDVFCWVTDMGWIMGPLSTFGTHANGATLVIYEGAPTVPTTHRLWELTARHDVTMLGVSPTLIRALRGEHDVEDLPDLSTVHTLGSTGEPWDPASYRWLARDVFGGRVPVINFSGGTEVGGSFLAPYPVEPIAECSLGGPSLGMDVAVFDADGRPIVGEVGELVCRQPWPSMTRGVWGDDQRYLETYWSMFPGVWRHGDWAKVEDGQWYLLGRSDETMNIAGKRLGPAEVESVLTSHPGVAEAAAIGVPDAAKGEAVWCFWVANAHADSDLSDDLKALVGAELGRPFAPALVRRVEELPKTRSAKIMRRAVRAAALGEDPGDLSSAENPGALEHIRGVVAT